MSDKNRRIGYLLLLVLSLTAARASYAAPEETLPEPNVITLQGLNKVTGRTLKFDGLLGTVMRFGNLEIVARRCWKAPPEERPENAALLEISELKRGEPPVQVFLGWMFSSSPSLSGIEHPVYDISVISCDVKSKPETDDAATKTPDDEKTDPQR